MKQSNAKEAVKWAFENRQPLMLWGAPGVGKSDIVRAAAADLDVPVIDMRLSQMDAVDLRGVPVPHADKGTTDWLPPAELPVASRDGEFGILFTDELSAAAKPVQVAAYQLYLDRALGQYKLPAGWATIAAGNRVTDGAVAFKMSSALASRMTHIEIDVNLDDWCNWAMDSGIDPRVIAFLRFRPDLLHSQDPKVPGSFPCPRTWEKTSRAVLQAPKNLRLDLLQGTLGEGPASEFESFLRDYDALPNIDALLSAPMDATVPGDDQPSARYAVVAAVSHKANEINIDNVVKYMRRLPREFQVLAMTMISKSHPELCKTAPMIRLFADLGSQVFGH